MESSQIARVRSVNQAVQSASPFPAAALLGAEIDAGPRIENVSGHDHDPVVKDWLRRARNAIPQYERDEKRADWCEAAFFREKT